MLSKPKINADIAKTMLMSYYLYKRNHCLVMPEVQIFDAIADIITISKEGVSYEVEIKTDKRDLLNELKIIDEIQQGMPHQEYYEKKRIAKYRKHDHYKRGYCHNDFSPKYYYIAVPVHLVGTVKCELTNSSYGIISLDLTTYGEGRKLQEVKVVKRAKALHDKKVCFEKIRERVFFKLSFMNLNTMQKLYL